MIPPLTPERAELLLGGFATGTLTPEEHAALMAAAMADQRLFDALVDEEALREALADPQTRAELIRALSPAPSRSRFWRAPWPWAALATTAAAAALFVLLRPQPALRDVAKPATAVPQQIAQNLPQPEPQPVEIPVPSKLTLRPEADFAKTKGRPEDENLPATKPALPAPAPVPPAAAPPPPAEFRQKLGDDKAVRPLAAPAQPMAQDAVATGVAAGRVNERTEVKKEKTSAPLVVALAFQQPDATWTAIDAGAAAPAGRSLRLRVTTDRDGILSFNPALAPPAPVRAGEPLTVILPGRQAGELAFRISLAPLLDAAARGDAEVFKTRAVASETAAANLAAAPALRDSAILTRDIKLRIE
ncbi:MAG: hypothetical protein HZB13_12215 [Acidobacteria bacterium]|nr:hypothetical protein [Acidobacteriota bacterium]